MARVMSRRPSPATVIALLALFVALSGVAWAGLKKNSVGTKQIKPGAVTETKISASAQTALKGQKGDQGTPGAQGPPGPTFGATATGPVVPTDPPATPDEPSSTAATAGRDFDFTLPTPGKVYVRFSTRSMSRLCSAGGTRAGLYLDGAPVPQTGQGIGSTTPLAAEFISVIPAAAGPHVAEVLEDCPSGSLGSSSDSNSATWSVLLLGG